jgi:hypothetical protein
MSKRFFTPSTARNALNKLRPVAERLCELYRAMEFKRPRPVAAEQRVDSDYFCLLRDLHAGLEAIRATGAEMKDLKSGLLDFPARREGRPVLLCWRVGEDSLEFWHETGSGFDGRRRVDDDGPWDEI